MDVVMWNRVEKPSGIASIMMSTVNFQLMSQARHAIRLYQGLPGYRLETYSKSQFVQKYGLTIYVTRENVNIRPVRLLRSLFYKTPSLHTPTIKFLCKSTFESDHPDKPPGKRSRIGDAIFLFDSPDLDDKLKDYDEDHRFPISNSANVTVKGGRRGNEGVSFAAGLTSSVIGGSSADAMQGAYERA